MSNVGVDVAKRFLIVFIEGAISQVDNDNKAIRRLLKSLPEGSRVILEPTGRYHLLLANAAFEMGIAVFLVNPKEFRNYKDSLNFRAKTDAIDAEMLARYGEKEHDLLVRYAPRSAKVSQVNDLLRLRACMVESRRRMAQSFGEISKQLTADLACVNQALDAMTRAISELEERIHGLLADEPLYHKLQKIIGVGKLISAAMCSVLLERSFGTSDAFVAFLGLDIQVYQSGQKRGKGRLTKRGDPLFRQLLYVAAGAAIRNKHIRTIYDAYLLKGKHTTQALVIMARRIARTIWSVATKPNNFCINRFMGVDIQP